MTDFRENNSAVTASEADIPLERDVFLREMVRALSLSLENVIGLEDASGYLSLVGQVMGEQIDEQYRSALQVERLSREQVADVLVDLKKRIKGDFYVIEESDEKLVLGNRRCPFGDKVIGRKSLCMMTSNVFGYISAQNLGYAKVELQETIAEGHDGCRVVVYLKATNQSRAASGREYATY